MRYELEDDEMALVIKPLYEANGEWEGEAEAFSNVKILCGVCYDNVKLLNFPSKKAWWRFW